MWKLKLINVVTRSLCRLPTTYTCSEIRTLKNTNIAGKCTKMEGYKMKILANKKKW